MVKYVILCFAIFYLYNSTLGQSEYIDAHTIRKPVFYKEIDNPIEVFTDSDTNYTLECVGCDTLYQVDSTHFSVIPSSKSKMVYLIYLDAQNSHDTLHISGTKVQAIPSPIVYHGATRNGYRTSRKFNRFYLEYPSEMNLEGFNKHFKILSWEVNILNSVYTGKGDLLTEEVMSLLMIDKSIQSMSVFILAEGPGGIKRYIGGAFKF